MFKNHGPGGCCCCECWKDSAFTNWEVVSGSWIAGVTSSDNAVLASNRQSDPLQLLFASVSPPKTGDEVRVGFRNTAGDQVYVEGIWASANTIGLTAYEHPNGGSRSSLGTIATFTATQWNVLVLFDDDYNRFSVWKRPTSGVWYALVSKYLTTLSVDRGFVGTGNIDQATTFALSYDMNCFCRYCKGIGASGSSGGIHLAPTEFEISVSGLADDPTYPNLWTTFNDDWVLAHEPYTTQLPTAEPISIWGSVGLFQCYWTREVVGIIPYGAGSLFLYVDYDSATDISTVSFRLFFRWSAFYGGGTSEYRWSRDISGRIDARTLDLSGSDKLTATDLVYISNAIAQPSVGIEIVASP